MNARPKSPHEKVGGMVYFARMLDKIRLHAKGELHPEYHANLGSPRTGDHFCTGFLKVAYADLKERVLAGGTDEEILQWCFEKGRKLDVIDLHIWNEFARKLGWNDRGSAYLEKFKVDGGFAGRTDILTMFDLMDLEEGRKP